MTGVETYVGKDLGLFQQVRDQCGYNLDCERWLSEKGER